MIDMDNVKSKSNSLGNIIGYGSKGHKFVHDWAYDLINNMNKIIENENIIIGLLEKEYPQAEKYKWHDLRKDPNDLPEKADDDSKSGYSKEVLIISSLFNEVWLGYMKLSDKKWFDSVDGELLSKPVMWKYIELPDEKSVSSEVEDE